MFIVLFSIQVTTTIILPNYIFVHYLFIARIKASLGWNFISSREGTIIAFPVLKFVRLCPRFTTLWNVPNECIFTIFSLHNALIISSINSNVILRPSSRAIFGCALITASLMWKCVQTPPGWYIFFLMVNRFFLQLKFIISNWASSNQFLLRTGPLLSIHFLDSSFDRLITARSTIDIGHFDQISFYIELPKPVS